MLKRVFLSVPATLDIRDLIHLNLINHLLKSDLGLKKWSLCVASSCWYQTALCCGFHYLSEFTSEEGKGLLAKGHRFSFYCQRNKSGWPQKRPKVTVTQPIHRGAVRDHTWDLIAIVLRSCDRSWQACSNIVRRASCENAFCLKPVPYHKFEVSSLAPEHFSVFFFFSFCRCYVWTFCVLTDTVPVWDGHYLWPCSGYHQWPRKEWRLSLRGGWRVEGQDQKAEEPRCLFSLTFSAAPNRCCFLCLPCLDVSKTDHLSGGGGDARTPRSPLDQATPFDLKYAAPGKTVPSLNCKVPRCIALPLIYHDWTGSRFNPPVLTVYRLQQPCSEGWVRGSVVMLCFFIPEMYYCLSFSFLYAGPLCSKDIGFRGTRRGWCSAQSHEISSEPLVVWFPYFERAPGSLFSVLSDTSIF